MFDTGERDEHGMQPLDDLLSSPEKEPSRPNQAYDDEEEDDDQFENENGDDEDEDDEGSEAMDIETSALIEACNKTH